MGVALISVSLNLVKREADLLKHEPDLVNRDTVKWILMYIEQAVLTQTAPHSYLVVNVCPALAVFIRERTKLLKSRHVYNFSLVFWRPPSPKHVWGILKPAFKGACAPRLKVSAPRDVIVRVYADIGVVLQFQEYAENIKNLIHILAIMEGFHWVWLDWVTNGGKRGQNVTEICILYVNRVR